MQESNSQFLEIFETSATNNDKDQIQSSKARMSEEIRVAFEIDKLNSLFSLHTYREAEISFLFGTMSASN